MTDEPKPEEKKIVVDEDWKSQVEAEKEATREPQEQDSGSGPRLPPPDLVFLASSLYLQGMVCLGLLPNPMSDKPKLQLDQAQHAIDTLQVLQDKTEGNRTPEESAALENMLHDLRMAYIAVQEKQK
jgi:hypothetical protein